MYFWFIAWRFIKPTLAILFALEFFFICIDSLQYIDNFNSSINTIILFMAYECLYVFNYVSLLSLILGLIVFYIGIVKSNQYIALLSLGYSKKKIFFVPLVFIILSIIFYIILNATPFAYAQENAENIIKKNEHSSISNDLFIRYNTDYVFFQRIYPLLQKAENIKVYHIEQDHDGRKLTIFTQAKEGYFINNEWKLLNPTIAILPESYTLGEKGYRLEKYDELTILKGFRPKILDTIYQNKPSISTIDALQSFKILSSENSSTNQVRGILYSLLLVPFFIPMLCVIVAYYIPALPRYGNLSSTAIALSIMSLLVWGAFFSLGKLNANEIFLPEIGILLPLATLFAVSTIYFFKLNKI